MSYNETGLPDRFCVGFISIIYFHVFVVTEECKSMSTCVCVSERFFPKLKIVMLKNRKKKTGSKIVWKEMLEMQLKILRDCCVVAVLEPGGRVSRHYHQQLRMQETDACEKLSYICTYEYR